MSDIEKIRLLEKENQSLKARIASLEKKIAFHENHPLVSKGIKGEALIAKLLNGKPTSHNANHDLFIPAQNIKIEVKFSGLNTAVRKVDSKTKRWSWFNVLGGVSEKEYDYLILIGESDLRFQKYYLDNKSPYVFFLVPKDEVFPLTISTNSGRNRTIQLTSNPRKAKSTASKLYTDFQVTVEYIEKEFES